MVPDAQSPALRDGSELRRRRPQRLPRSEMSSRQGGSGPSIALPRNCQRHAPGTAVRRRQARHGGDRPDEPARPHGPLGSRGGPDAGAEFLAGPLPGRLRYVNRASVKAHRRCCGGRGPKRARHRQTTRRAAKGSPGCPSKASGSKRLPVRRRVPKRRGFRRSLLLCARPPEARRPRCPTS